MIRCTVGLMAHNEAQNIQHALHALLAQELKNVEVLEILVIASGCTDNTVELAQAVARAHPLVRVEVEATRAGKAAAIKRLIALARGDVIVLAGADTLLEPGAIEQLAAPFADRLVGMTGARVVPLNLPTTWLGFAVQMLWHVHHHLALRKPKLGELVAFRNVLREFPEDTSTDEPAIEALIAAKSYRLVYAPKAVVYNRGPERASEFLVQRRRIFAGQVRIALNYGYFTSSLSVRHVLPLAVEAIRSYPRFFLWTFAAMGVEAWARCLGLVDALRGHEDAVWRMAPTSKTMVSDATREPLTLISVNWAPGTLNARAFLKDLRAHSEPAGTVFWWDATKGEILLFVGGESPLEWFEERIGAVTREHVRPRPFYSNSASRVSVSWVRPVSHDRPLVSCRMVKFTAPASN
jgi:glycosyltransferase involved in cell wall biosynthesis